MILEKQQQAQEVLENLLNRKIYKKKQLAVKIGISDATFVRRFKDKTWNAEEIDTILNDL